MIRTFWIAGFVAMIFIMGAKMTARAEPAYRPMEQAEQGPFEEPIMINRWTLWVAPALALSHH